MGLLSIRWGPIFHYYKNIGQRVVENKTVSKSDAEKISPSKIKSKLPKTQLLINSTTESELFISIYFVKKKIIIIIPNAMNVLHGERHPSRGRHL